MHGFDEVEFTRQLIVRLVRRLVGTAGITRAEIPDFQQEIWYDVLERWSLYRYEPRCPRAFITRVVKNKIATLLEARRALKRGADCPCMSLDEEIFDDDGVRVERHEILSADDYLRRMRGIGRSECDRRDLELDIHKMVSLLAPEDRVLCTLWLDHPISKVADILSLPRSTLRDRVARICQRFEEVGLRDYIK